MSIARFICTFNDPKLKTARLFPVAGKSAINSGVVGPESTIAIGTAANVAPIEGEEEWNMISPYGEFPNPLGLQVVNREYAETIVANFNSVLARLGRGFRGAPVYRGHPDVMPERWPDDKRYGRYDKLEAREDGLYGKPAWNSAGKENVREGFYVYPSPAWHYRELGGGRIAPTHLLSVGLTNTPNIASAVPVTNSKKETTTTQKDQQTMPKWLIDKLIACNVLAKLPEGQQYTEEQLQTALNMLEGKLTAANSATEAAQGQVTAINTEKSTLQGQLSTAQGDAAKYRANARDLLTTAAINEGRLPAAELTAVNTEFDKDFDAAAAALAKRTKAMNTTAIELGRTATNSDLSNPEARRLAMNARIDVLTSPIASGGKGMTFAGASNFIAAKSTPEDKALMDAMEATGANA